MFGAQVVDDIKTIKIPTKDFRHYSCRSLPIIVPCSGDVYATRRLDVRIPGPDKAPKTTVGLSESQG
jgi:hypothetical protein